MVMSKIFERFWRIEGLSALSSVNFRRFIAGYAFSSTASWMQRVCFAWLAWELTRSPFWLGAVAMAEFLPILAFSIASGSLIDGYDKRAIIRTAEAVSAAALLILLVVYAMDLANIPILFLAAFTVGTCMAVSHPTQLSWYPDLLSVKTHIGSAANIYIFGLNIARFLGAALAGVLISGFGLGAALLVTSLFYVVFVIVLATVDGRSSRPSGQRATAPAWKGMSYVAGHKVIGATLLLIGLTSLGGRGIPDLAPAIAELRLGQPSEAFTLLVAATGVGSVVAGIWNIAGGNHSLHTARRQTVVFSLIMALSAVSIASSTTLLAAALAFASLGFSVTMTAVKSQQVIQTTVDDHFRGRVNALYFLTFRGGTALGAAWMGATATAIGIPITIMIGAAFCAVGWLIYRLMEAAWMRRARLRTHSSEPE